MKIKLLSWSRS